MIYPQLLQPKYWGEILTQDIFKKSQADAISLAKKVKNESIALKAKASKAIEKEDSDDEENESESDGDMALFVKKFNKFMKKKMAQPRRGQTSRRNAFNDRKCFGNYEYKIIIDKLDKSYGNSNSEVALKSAPAPFLHGKSRKRKIWKTLYNRW